MIWKFDRDDGFCRGYTEPSKDFSRLYTPMHVSYHREQNNTYEYIASQLGSAWRAVVSASCRRFAYCAPIGHHLGTLQPRERDPFGTVWLI